MCAPEKFICVLSLYMADRQGGKQKTMATNHGYSLMLGCDLNPNPTLSSAFLGLLSFTEIAVESDVMHHLNPKYIRSLVI